MQIRKAAIMSADNAQWERGKWAAVAVGAMLELWHFEYHEAGSGLGSASLQKVIGLKQKQ